MSHHIPQEILDLAHARSAARAAREWETADRHRATIEAAGWKVVDRGTDFALSPMHPPDVVEDGRTRYGSSTSVPSRLEEPASGFATVVLVAGSWPADVERALASLDEHAPAGTHVVVVADDPSPEQSERLASLERADTEIVWTSAPLGTAAALNAGIRRASAEVVVILDTSVELTGDAITPLVRELDDPAVGVAGGWGIVSGDLRRFEEGGPGDVDVVEGYAMAFRRSDYAARGPLDERFRFYRNLDIWWSLALRDEGVDAPPRRAVALADLPVRRHRHRGYASLPETERDRLSKRNFYRIIDRFGERRDLLLRPAPRARR
jgi:GT2 family glycosyltransferase